MVAANCEERSDFLWAARALGRKVSTARAEGPFMKCMQMQVGCCCMQGSRSVSGDKLLDFFEHLHISLTAAIPEQA